MANVANQNLGVIGKNLDDCEEDASTLLLELFPDTVFSESILQAFERVFDVKPEGDYTARRSAVIAAHRARGGLSKDYFEALGNQMGNRESQPYTVTLTSGTGNVPFVVATYSPSTSPQGPATELPGQVTSPPWNTSTYTITVTVDGVDGPENELERKFNARCPAWCNFVYSYSGYSPPSPSSYSNLDTYIIQNQADDIHGSDTTCSHYGDPGAAANMQALIKWDQFSDLNSGTVTYATVMLYYDSTQGAQNTYIYRVTEPWDENATWNNRDADDTWAGGGATYDSYQFFSAQPAGGWTEYALQGRVGGLPDSTGLAEMQSFVDSTYVNHGFMIWPGNLGTNLCSFVSFQGADSSRHPILWVHTDSSSYRYQSSS